MKDFEGFFIEILSDLLSEALTLSLFEIEKVFVHQSGTNTINISRH